LLEAVVKAKPLSSKGQYIKSISISSTMGPGIFVEQRI
jgi:large subunit ribosomal protein L1